MDQKQVEMIQKIAKDYISKEIKDLAKDIVIKFLSDSLSKQIAAVTPPPTISVTKTFRNPNPLVRDSDVDEWLKKMDPLEYDVDEKPDPLSPSASIKIIKAKILKSKAEEE